MVEILDYRNKPKGWKDKIKIYLLVKRFRHIRINAKNGDF